MLIRFSFRETGKQGDSLVGLLVGTNVFGRETLRPNLVVGPPPFPPAPNCMAWINCVSALFIWRIGGGRERAHVVVDFLVQVDAVLVVVLALGVRVGRRAAVTKVVLVRARSRALAAPSATPAPAPPASARLGPAPPARGIGSARGAAGRRTVIDARDFARTTAGTFRREGVAVRTEGLQGRHDLRGRVDGDARSGRERRRRRLSRLLQHGRELPRRGLRCRGALCVRPGGE